VSSLSSVLIANRGEVALRVIRACRELGLRTVAVASEADRVSLHAREADRVVLLEGRGYLDAAQLVAAAKASGAGALHPGYGFLAENADFASACREAGLVFIGPPPSAIRTIGNKVNARSLMAKAGVPVLPGAALSPKGSSKARLDAAKSIGFPLLVKAAAGGGGKGQRVVEGPKGLEAGVAAAAREALSAFGDGAVFLEKYLTAPRHVEFQVLRDPEGRTVHLFERECSIQRRQQKLLEESPSPALTPALRKAMGAAAMKAAEVSGYRNLGTVEFLLDGKDFYFLEVNARLQVEHPVTEAVLGLDLVQWQIRMALGEAFGYAQEDLKPRGHAIEARICAEDPDRDFLPTGGRVEALALPVAPGVRWDTALEEGIQVGVEYDPLLAKVIAWAEDRPRAIRRLDEALSRTVLLGFSQNIPYLRFVLDHPDFSAGRYSTDFATRTAAAWGQTRKGRKIPPEVLAAAEALRKTGLDCRDRREGARREVADPWVSVSGWLP
jgi:acetyl-CoA/propionyl-CoA carboxylase biotin carboxyl carrier protein